MPAWPEAPERQGEKTHTQLVVFMYWLYHGQSFIRKKSLLCSKMLCNMITHPFFIPAMGVVFHILLYQLPAGKSLCVLALRAGTILIHHFGFFTWFEIDFKTERTWKRRKQSFTSTATRLKLCSPLCNSGLSIWLLFMNRKRKMAFYHNWEAQGTENISPFSPSNPHRGCCFGPLLHILSPLAISIQLSRSHISKKVTKRTDKIPQEDTCFPPKN